MEVYCLSDDALSSLGSGRGLQGLLLQGGLRYPSTPVSGAGCVLGPSEHIYWGERWSRVGLRVGSSIVY